MEVELWQDGAEALWIGSTELGYRPVTPDDSDFASDAMAILVGTALADNFPLPSVEESNACIVATCSLENGGNLMFDIMSDAAARYIDLRAVAESVIKQSVELAPYADDLLRIWLSDDEDVEYWKYVISQPPSAVIDRFNL